MEEISLAKPDDSGHPFTEKPKIMKPAMKVLSALGIGLAAGAVAGILLAPRKGEDTRKLIRRKGEDLADRMKFNLKKGEKMVAHLKEDVEDTLNGIGKKASQFT
jgi:gas vesicle protein